MESLPDASVRLAYSITETAQLIGLSKRTVERLITRRELRAVAVGRRVLVPADELARFLGVQACAKAQVPLGPPAVLRAPVSEPLAARAW
ncbi:MAG: helix-turn-helix domain-containing protein [Steroidobacteraceae bacterium]